MHVTMHVVEQRLFFGRPIRQRRADVGAVDITQQALAGLARFVTLVAGAVAIGGPPISCGSPTSALRERLRRRWLWRCLGLTPADRIGPRRSTITLFPASQRTLVLACETASAASDQSVVDAGPIAGGLLNRCILRSRRRPLRNWRTLGGGPTYWATIGVALSFGARGSVPANRLPSSNQERGAGAPHSVCRCGSRRSHRMGS
jgi:hypothetical protein